MRLIKCHNCGKTLLEAAGEGKKICPKCKTLNHYSVTGLGVFYFDQTVEPGDVIIKDDKGNIVTRFKITI